MDFSFSSLFAGLFFGTVGFAAFRFGRKTERPRPMVLGMALIVMPWLITSTLWQWVVGLLLIVGLFVP